MKSFIKKPTFDKKKTFFYVKNPAQWVKWVYTRVHTLANPGEFCSLGTREYFDIKVFNRKIGRNKVFRIQFYICNPILRRIGAI